MKVVRTEAGPVQRMFSWCPGTLLIRNAYCRLCLASDVGLFVECSSHVGFCGSFAGVIMFCPRPRIPINKVPPENVGHQGSYLLEKPVIH